MADQERRILRTIEVDDARREGDAVRLMQLLRHDVLHDATTRRAAIGALGELRAAESVELLCGYARSSDEKTRVAAVVALRKIGSATAVDHLVAALSDVDRVAWAAADALAAIRSKRAVPALACLLENHDNWWVRRSAAGALSLIGGRGSVNALRQAKQSERNLLRRRSLARLLRTAEISILANQ